MTAVIALVRLVMLLKECPSAGSRVETADGVAPERQETNRRIETARAEIQKGVLPLCRVAAGIASVRRRDNRLRFWRKRKAGNHKSNRSERDVSNLHKLLISFQLVTFVRRGCFFAPARMCFYLLKRKSRVKHTTRFRQHRLI